MNTRTRRLTTGQNRLAGPNLLLAAAAAIVAVALAACSTGAGPSGAAPTASDPASAAFLIKTAPVEPQACMDALIAGKLVQTPASGLGISPAGGEVTAVEWPFRYSARIDSGRVSLLDETGKVVAREGDEISVGGGFGNQFWHACAPVSVMPPG